ncbi:MAG TPA: hypothetical protein VF069_26265 [Streptosporangiaceae bacterium]
MGRASLLSVLVALLLAGTPAVTRPASAGSFPPHPASPARASAGSLASSPVAGCDGDFPTRLRCWRKRTQEGKRVEVSLSRPLPLDGPVDRLDWSQYQDAFAGRPFTVTVPAGGESGAGGTVLLILAGERGQRFVAQDSKITALPGATVEAIAPVCDALCAAVNAAAAGGGQVPGKSLIDNKLALPLPSDRGGSAWRVAFPVVLLLLLGLLGFSVRRTLRLRVATDLGAADEPTEPYAPHRQEARGAPAAPAAPAGGRRARHRYGRYVDIPPGPRRAAVVRSGLHPQGYVEVDRCLFRAVWADHQAPAPGLGDSVDVVQGAGPDSDILLALPPTPGTRH